MNEPAISVASAWMRSNRHSGWKTDIILQFQLHIGVLTGSDSRKQDIDIIVATLIIKEIIWNIMF